MIKQDVIGELLYIGFVAEKGRIGGKWKIGYKRELHTHLLVLSRLIDALSDKTVNMNCLIKDFLRISGKYKCIRKSYPFSEEMLSRIKKEDIIWEEDSNDYNEIVILMQALITDALCEINRSFTNKKKVNYIIRSLHNLPKVYLGKGKETLCKLNQNNISIEDAMQYSYQNMDKLNKEKHAPFMQNYL